MSVFWKATSAITALVACGLFVAPAHAALMRYTITGVGSGSLGTTPFTDADFVITTEADTDDVFAFAHGFVVLSPSMRVFVAGIGSGDFANPTRTVSNQEFSRSGFGDDALHRGVTFVNNEILTSYDLRTPIGPVAGLLTFNADASFPTTAGDFSLTEALDGTFTAAAVPEPPSAALVLSACVFGCLALWRARS